jgi:hypothetical protein
MNWCRSGRQHRPRRPSGMAACARGGAQARPCVRRALRYDAPHFSMRSAMPCRVAPIEVITADVRCKRTAALALRLRHSFRGRMHAALSAHPRQASIVNLLLGNENIAVG